MLNGATFDLGRVCVGAFAAVILTIATALADPIILTTDFATHDAPEVVAADHGHPGQNAALDWMTPGVDANRQPALYLFASVLREDAAAPPMMALMNLLDGRLKEFYPGDPVRLQRDDSRDPLLGATMSEKLPPLNVPWPWGRPICGAATPDGRLFLALEPDEPTARRWPIVIYEPQTDSFEEWTVCHSQPAGMVYTDQGLFVLTADGRLYTEDILEGLDPVGRLSIKGAQLHGLEVDREGRFYTASGPAPWRLWTFRVTNNEIEAEPLLRDLTLDSLTFQSDADAPRCVTVVNQNGSFARRVFELRDGLAHPTTDTAVWSAHIGDTNITLKTDFNIHPLTVGVRQADNSWQHFPLAFRRAAQDRIKTLLAVPGGNGVYGAGWPTAWVWRFDPAAGQFRVFGRHYVMYRMHAWQDEIWATGYWGIKLLRWRPEEPWTFDYSRHYHRKRYPGNTSPWGDQSISNPRLVAKFRYLKQLNLRRPGTSVITDNGWLWVGGFTPTVEHFNSRFGGAVSWYDPHSETIGRIAEPFVHHSVRAVSRAGSGHVAAAASQFVSPYEPLPPDFSPGKFVLIDTRTRDVVFESSPLDAPLSYAAEGEPGRIVVYGGPGRYAGDGVRGAFFIFDVETMQVTHVVRLPVRMVWMEYDNSTRFERGPDNQIYFYGRDDHGVALCRVDSLTGTVEPVLRGRHITDAGVYNNTGAPFAFADDRVYFGARRLVSLPLETVTGPLPEEDRVLDAVAHDRDFAQTDTIVTASADTDVDIAVAPPFQMPAIQRLVWRRAQQIDWHSSQGPAWYSLGHLNRVLTCIPRDADGRPLDADNSPLRARSVDVAVYDVTAFDDVTGLPVDVRRRETHTLRPDDPEARTRQRWRFPSETPIDWALDRLPQKPHQTLFRLFFHDDMPIWQTLMIQTEADPGAADDSTPANSHFASMYLHGMVFELLHDPDLAVTSTYIEPDDPPCRNWWPSGSPPPPWIQTHETLAPMWGSLAFGDDDHIQFMPATERAVAERRNLADKAQDENFPEIGERLPEDWLENW